MVLDPEPLCGLHRGDPTPHHRRLGSRLGCRGAAATLRLFSGSFMMAADGCGEMLDCAGSGWEGRPGLQLPLGMLLGLGCGLMGSSTRM